MSKKETIIKNQALNSDEFLQSSINTDVKINGGFTTEIEQPEVSKIKLSPMLMTPATQQLTAINTNIMKPKVDQITNKAQINSGFMTITMDDYNPLTDKLKPSTHKLLLACQMQLTNQNNYKEKDSNKINPNIIISIDDYMEKCGIPNTKSSKDRIRRILKNDIETLMKILLKWEDKTEKKSKVKDFELARICSYGAIKQGNIKFNFTMEYASFLVRYAALTQIHEGLLRIDERNSNALPLALKLHEHYFMESNIVNGTNNMIKIKNLLKICPDIATYEEVMKTDHHVTQRIKYPLDNALSCIEFTSWDYVTKKNKVISNEEVMDMEYSKYEELYIQFEFNDSTDTLSKLKKSGADKKKRRVTKKKTAPTTA